MTEIVFTETLKQRQGIPDMTYGRQPTDKKVTVFKNPGKVAVVQSTLVCGVPRPNSDKRYYYWRSVASSGFRRNKSGTIVPFSCSRSWHAKVGVPWRQKLPNRPFDWLHETSTQPDGAPDGAVEAFKRAVWDEFSIRDVTEMYPMLDKYNLPSYLTIPDSLKVPFRADDWEDFTAKVFGKTRTNNNKRLVAAVQQTEPYFVAYAQQFRGLVSDAQVESFLDRNHFDEEMEETFSPHSPTIRPFLLVASQGTRDNLISVDFDAEDLRRVSRFVKFGPYRAAAHADCGKTTYKDWKQLVR